MAIGAFPVLKLAVGANGFSIHQQHYLLREGYPVTWRDEKSAVFLCAIKNVRDNW